MPKKIEYKKGEKIGVFTYVSDAPKRGKQRRGNFLCHCGNEISAAFGHVKNGHTSNCVKCTSKIRAEAMSERAKIHGYSTHPEYHIYTNMMDRCYNPKCDRYEDYGGRGIKVCKRWVDNIENFFKDMGTRLHKDDTLERKDVDGDYSPENCCWLARPKQSANKRNTIRLLFNGETKPITEWCELLGMNYDTTRQRIARNKWPIEKVFSFATKVYKKRETEIKYAFGFIDA